MVIKADSPAGFAEQYIVESIWNGGFSPGTILPAERELSEMIGVTRTTLREVLQRLSRDGWLTIKHGKPTQVNNFWETSSLNVLSTLAKLEQSDLPTLVKQLIQARNQISRIYWVDAVQANSADVLLLLSEYRVFDDANKGWQVFDQQLQRQVISLSQNPIYLLVQNGFDGLYKDIAPHLFSHKRGEELLKHYYQSLYQAIQANSEVGVEKAITEYNEGLLELWREIKESVIKSMRS